MTFKELSKIGIIHKKTFHLNMHYMPLSEQKGNALRQ